MWLGIQGLGTERFTCGEQSDLGNVNGRKGRYPVVDGTREQRATKTEKKLGIRVKGTKMKIHKTDKARGKRDPGTQSRVHGLFKLW